MGGGWHSSMLLAGMATVQQCRSAGPAGKVAHGCTDGGSGAYGQWFLYPWMLQRGHCDRQTNTIATYHIQGMLACPSSAVMAVLSRHTMPVVPQVAPDS
jgi:hypothetical protein